MSKPNSPVTTASDTSNVVDLFTRETYRHPALQRFIRLAPELDGLEMLYSNDSHPEKLFSIKILCWGLKEDGDIVGLVPWLTSLSACPEISDPLNGHWQGYYDPGIDELFYEAPIHKALELETAADYYEYTSDAGVEAIQEIPDTIGTHAIFSEDGFKTLKLLEVVSWRLLNNGNLEGMVADQDKVIQTPILPGDDCLFPADGSTEFRYYFQHHIANQIKAQDPDALEAIAQLIDS